MTTEKLVNVIPPASSPISQEVPLYLSILPFTAPVVSTSLRPPSAPTLVRYPESLLKADTSVGTVGITGGVYVKAPDVELYVTSPLPLAVGLGLITEISVRAIPLPPLDVKSGPATHLVLERSHFNT